MYHDDDGPYPFRGRCVDVIIRHDSEDHPQAYVVLESVEMLRVPGGFEDQSMLIPEGDYTLFPVHRLYELEVADLPDPE